ncbi:MAG TPA: NADPH-dependent assimilatory sulfite reductase hemoprotein subunit [Planctomycetaceae bacterium]|nr:NADPH-dependent assimilatory sulfite reductase hemoprotein subunit [Planctomycetaceae bacterium]HBC63463.1 NADPH-dependent assimilatory sulfite reductase hemoprotein subunit [Planctomycetaceae bacterium]
MSDTQKLSKVELLKESSQQLRGTLADELLNDRPEFSDDAATLLKHHGSYLQDDRDTRRAKGEDGKAKGKQYSCMVRTAIPGGRLTAQQLLAELDLCELLANGTLRITSRQGLQLHGVLKSNLKASIREINRIKLTTFAACGDVNRNVMACPAPVRNDAVRAGLQEMAAQLALHFRPKTTSYFDIWLKDEDGVEQEVGEFQPVDEPIYGPRYLPRKFKMGVGLPEDNCVDLYTQDLGLLAIVENGQIIGWNVLAGGGMGRTPSAEKTFPALAKRLCFATPEQVIAVCEAIVKVQRDFGNREDRKRARLKYLISDWGVAKFRETVEQYFGGPLADPHPADVTGVDDHLGWHEQGDGRLFLGINVENGRIKDEGSLRLKAGLRAILGRFGMEVRLTPLQSLILCDIDPADRKEIERMMSEYGILRADQLSLLRRYAIACPAFPTCGLSITESERALPGVIDQLEVEVAKLGLQTSKLAVHMTGCPNGCARPYTPDVGLVGKAVGKYTVFVGGNPEGTRLAFIYRDMVPLEEIVPALVPLLQRYRVEREGSESFGDFCARRGPEAIGAAG